jgi:SAM-dependent methyltransferase
MNSLKLHLGCGLTTPAGWLNVDGSWNAKLARWPGTRKMLAVTRMISTENAAVAWGSVMYCDLRKRFPWGDATAAVVYASHLLEHLYRDQARRFLGECHRVLRPHGVVRVTVPDLEALVRSYVEALGASAPADTETESPADRFMSSTWLRSSVAPQGSLAIRIYRLLTEFESHKWMYDARSLSALVRDAGFAEVAVTDRHVSRIDDVHLVETNTGLIVEAVKPA